MKRLLLILFCGVLSTNAVALQKETARVAMNGVIIVPACSIAAEAQDQSIELGVIDTDNFASGSTLAYPFSIRLLNCLMAENSEVKNTLTVAFMGANEHHQPWFGLQGNTEGFGMQITDGSGHVIQPGVATAGNTVTSNNDSLHYVASLIKTAEQIKPGGFNATVSFIIDYK